jgi:hypothetical protein
MDLSGLLDLQSRVAADLNNHRSVVSFRKRHRMRWRFALALHCALQDFVEALGDDYIFAGL